MEPTAMTEAMPPAAFRSKGDEAASAAELVDEDVDDLYME